MTAPSTPYRLALPFVVACVGIAVFSAMDAAMKGVALALGAYNALLWRNLFALSFSGVAWFGARKSWPRRHVMRIHVWRGVISAVFALLFFYALARLPIAETIALSFIAPLIALYLAALLLGERIERKAIFASILGLAGVAVIVAGRLGRSDYGEEAIAGIVAIFASALLYAYNLILARQQALLAKPLEIAFFQYATSTACLMLAGPWLAVRAPPAILPAVALSAALAFTALLLLSWAYARAEAQVLIPVEYTAFLWAAAFGWYIYGEPLTWPIIGGTVLIVSGSIVAARNRPETAPIPETPLA